uniref:Centromere protein Q n=1 Tax=Catharus ustulatus TaxID=91951 RepID=A0A8C3U1S8_CATUS
KKPCQTSSSKMGKPTGGRSSKNPFKSQNQQRTSSKKKGADEQGRKQGQKRQSQRCLSRFDKSHLPFSPFITGGNGSSKTVKLSSAAIGSWQPLSENSRLFLENTLDSIRIFFLLCKELQTSHKFHDFKGASRELGNLKNIQNLQVAEKQMLETNEQCLLQLQDEITEVERLAEHIKENTLQLQHKIQVLKNQVEEDEKEARKVFLINTCVLCNLEELPKCSLQAPTLQEEILKVKNQGGLLKDLNAIQRSADLKNLLTLVEKTYEKVDLL